MKVLFICIGVLLSGSAYTQEKGFREKLAIMDSIKMVYLEQAALKYPLVRQISISSEYVSSQRMVSRSNGEVHLKGDVQLIRSKFNAKIPVLSWRQNTISASVGVLHQNMMFDNLQSVYNSALTDDRGIDVTTLSFAVGFSGVDSLFNCPMIYSLNASGIADRTVENYRFAYTGVASFNIKRSAKTNLSLGIVASIDPSLIVPVFPLISYSYRFQNRKMELLADLPYRLQLRKELSSKSFLSVGTELGGSTFFFKIKNSSLPLDVVYATSELKSGLLYEYRVSRKIVLSINGGILTPISSKVFRKGHYLPNDYLVKSSVSSEPYINVSISMLPFMNGFRL
ncbi:MAG: DUF6268 family outer membrane beta-barrel protein [Bacteroidales bacterium]